MSLKKNILFGKEFNDKTYDQVVRCCALKDDLAQLTAKTSVVAKITGQ